MPKVLASFETVGDEPCIYTPFQAKAAGQQYDLFIIFQ